MLAGSGAVSALQSEVLLLHCVLLIIGSPQKYFYLAFNVSNFYTGPIAVLFSPNAWECRTLSCAVLNALTKQICILMMLHNKQLSFAARPKQAVQFQLSRFCGFLDQGLPVNALVQVSLLYLLD